MKYCPLCRSEFREPAVTCRECNVSLVESLRPTGAPENRRRLLWIGKDLSQFHRVLAALQDADIPARAVESGRLGRILKFVSRIYVLASDFSRAIAVADAAFDTERKIFDLTQTCYSCGAESSAALTACPKCGAELQAEQVEAVTRFAPSDAADLKYCPQCDSRYLSHYRTCSVCGVELLAEAQRGLPDTVTRRKDPLELVWRGGDPVALGRVIAALEAEGVRHFVQSTDDHLVFELAMPRPKYNVWILHGDSEKAKGFLAGIDERPFFGADVTVDSSADDSMRASNGFSTRWNPAAAIVPVWTSDDSALTRWIEACLYENGIGFRRQGIEPGNVQLSVQREVESRAREIIREIVEGPPQE